MILAVTGHRPDKLGGYGLPDSPLRTWVRNRLRETLKQLAPDKAISGMAQGVDQDFAQACVDLAIPYVAAVPFKGQEVFWSTEAQRAYRTLLNSAAEVIYVSGPSTMRLREKMLLRNHWMVDHCDKLLAVFDGTPGGTATTYLYAQRVGRPVHRIDPREFVRDSVTAQRL